jgi:hypothetical protein
VRAVSEGLYKLMRALQLHLKAPRSTEYVLGRYLAITFELGDLSFEDSGGTTSPAARPFELKTFRFQLSTFGVIPRLRCLLTSPVLRSTYIFFLTNRNRWILLV